jgi:hypothetical protein
MSTSEFAGTAGRVAVTVQAPGQTAGQATSADVGAALERARVVQEQAREQARLAQEQARVAQEQAQDVQRDVQRQIQQEMERARREIDRAVRDAQQNAARSGREGRPIIVQPPPPFPGSGPQVPEAAIIISVAFFVMCAVIAVGLPIARAWARRMDKRNAVAPVSDADTRARLERIEQAVDAIAVEVERISEGQRFTTKVIGDLRGLPQPDPSAAAPERVPVPMARAREAR